MPSWEWFINFARALRAKVSANIFAQTARTTFWRGLHFLRLLSFPLTLIVGSLVASAYVLGVFLNSDLPFYDFRIAKTCAGAIPNVMNLHSEIFMPGSEPELTLRLSSWDFETVCSAVEIFASSPDVRTYVKGRSKPSSEDDETVLLKNTEENGPRAHYLASSANISGKALTNVEWRFSPWRWSSFSQKGVVLNLDVSSSPYHKDEPVTLTFSLRSGYRLDPSTTPPPQRISLDGNTYAWELKPEIRKETIDRGQLDLVPTVRIIYESEFWSQVREYALFVIAAVFGFSIQLAADVLRNSSNN